MTDTADFRLPKAIFFLIIASSLWGKELAAPLARKQMCTVRRGSLARGWHPRGEAVFFVALDG